MATAIVSGRVDITTRDRAGAYIKAAGITAAEVIKRVWEHIALTGEIPGAAEDSQDTEDPFDDFMSFCSSLPVRENDWLDTLTDEEMRVLISEHQAEKHA